jgi:hypothetical protein
MHMRRMSGGGGVESRRGVGGAMYWVEVAFCEGDSCDVVMIDYD